MTNLYTVHAQTDQPYCSIKTSKVNNADKDQIIMARSHGQCVSKTAGPVGSSHYVVISTGARVL